MLTQRIAVSVGTMMALVALMTVPRSAQAQANGAANGSRALLGVPSGPSGFVSLNTGAAQARVAPSERALLGASSGSYVTLEPSAERSRRSAGEAALLGH